MRLSSVVAFFGVFLVVFAWTAEEYELFELNEYVKRDLGEEATFYSWLKLAKGPKSSFEEINRAYKKLSRSLHPDKVKNKRQKKRAEETFQRLSLVGQVLRSERREKYDYFLKTGFPKWKGTGYYYSKFRPGLVAVLFGLYLLFGAFQFIALKIGRAQDRKRLEGLISQLKDQAWSSDTPPKDLSDRKLVNGDTGKSFVVKFDGTVYLIDEENEDALLPLSTDDIRDPTVKDTLIYKFPIALWNMSAGRINENWIITAKVDEPPAPIQEQKEKRRPKPKGEKIELPNGKVIYGRNKTGVKSRTKSSK